VLTYRQNLSHSLEAINLKYLILILFIISQSAYAQCPVADNDCVPVGEWQFSITLGAGVITNPLNDGDNIPLIIVPNFSYYGEKVFIDNNSLGYTLFENNTLSFSAVSQINRENSFFERWHPNNVFVNTLSNSIVSEAQFDEATDAISGSGDTETDIIKVELGQIQERKWAIDAGLQVNWFFFEHSQLQVKLLHNINNVYNGLNGQLALEQPFVFSAIPNNFLTLTLGANWQSKEQVDYYYGIDAQDNVAAELYYQGKASLSPYVKFINQYAFNKDWSVKVTWQREWLASSLTNSPLVRDDVIDTFFIGVEYAL